MDIWYVQLGLHATTIQWVCGTLVLVSERLCRRNSGHIYTHLQFLFVFSFTPSAPTVVSWPKINYA